MAKKSLTGKLDEILSFRGAFSDRSLRHLRRAAKMVEPFDEIARDASPEDAFALFELIDLQGVFNTDFVSLLWRAAHDLQHFAIELIRSQRSLKDKHRIAMRFETYMHRITMALGEQGYILTQCLLNEVLAMRDCVDTNLEIHRLGIVGARARRIEQHKQHRHAEEQLVRSLRDFSWHELAHLAVRTASPTKPAPTQPLDDVRSLLRTVDIDFPEGRNVYLPYTFEPDSGLPLFRFSIRQSNNPLSLATLQLHDRATLEVIADGEISREGHILFVGCSFFSVRGIFEMSGMEHVYAYMRDMVTQSLYEMLEGGQLRERTYIRDEPTKEVEPEQIQVVEDVDPELVTVLPEVEPELVPAALNDLPNPATTVIEPRSVRIGKSHWGYRKVLAALVHFGVTVTSGGRHPKLQLGDKTAAFFNRHRREDPIYNRIMVHKALRALDIDIEAFEAHLRG